MTAHYNPVGGKVMATPQAQIVNRHYTIAEYLEFERAAEERHEYVDGEIQLMAGESPWHSVIKANLIVEVGMQLKGTGCLVFSPNMKIRSGEQLAPHSVKGLFSYADLSVVCGAPHFHDDFGDVLLNPKVIFEVLSPSTESFDRGEKFQRYRTYNESLTDYVLVWQTRPMIEHFQRQPHGQWLMSEAIGLAAELHLASIACRLRLAEIYALVTFPTPAAAPPPPAEQAP